MKAVKIPRIYPSGRKKTAYEAVSEKRKNKGKNANHRDDDDSLPHTREIDYPLKTRNHSIRFTPAYAGNSASAFRCTACDYSK